MLDGVTLVAVVVMVVVAFLMGFSLRQVGEGRLARAVVRSLGSRIDLVDSKVTKLEHQFTSMWLVGKTVERPASERSSEVWAAISRLVRMVVRLEEKRSMRSGSRSDKGIPGMSRLGASQMKILKILSAGGPLSSSVLGREVGKSREHTARVMKELFELGYVERDVTVFPYTYRVASVKHNCAGTPLVNQSRNVQAPP